MAYVLLGILGLALLMVVHEGGHYLAARAFGMRVTKFSIGFGPALLRKKPEGSPTTYQVALLPFLAYVQIAGMNPLEEVDPNDRGSYANASLIGRSVTIFAGPLANYLFASVLFFASLVIGGQEVLTTRVDVAPDGAAAAAHMLPGDKIVEVAGERITDWDRTRKVILAHPGEEIDVAVEREGAGTVHLKVRPTPTGEHGGGRIGVAARTAMVPVPTGRAAALAVEQPARIVVGLVVGLARMITGQERPELSGPVGIVRETAKAVRRGLPDALGFLGALSAYLGGFNLLPFPALDGGRMMFLGYEAATRRRPNARVEAQVHFVGLAMMLALIVVVTVVSDLPGRGH